MSHKEFKLVPIKHFKRLIELERQKSEQERVMEGTSKHRTIKTIIDNECESIKQNEDEMDIKPSSHFSADMKLSKGGGNNVSHDNIPLFLPSASTLPELSRANVMKHSFDDIKELLFNADIPNNLKVKLLHIYQNKYENSKRQASELETLDDDQDGILNTSSKSDKMIGKLYVLDKAIYSLKTSKQVEMAEKVKDVILTHSNVINWDQYGNIIKPNTRPTLNLNSLFKNLYYKNKGSAASLSATVKVIEPIYKYIEPFIVNGKVKTLYQKIVKNKKWSKYVAW